MTPVLKAINQRVLPHPRHSHAHADTRWRWIRIGIFLVVATSFLRGLVGQYAVTAS